MQRSASDQFVKAVHRRLMLLNLLEQIGRAMFAASLIAVALICIAIWQSMPTAPVLLFCESLGLLIGCGFAVHRWPTRMHAATQTDRQLRFDDLLTSALFSSPTTADDFGSAVLAMADVRCLQHSPSEVMLRQLGIQSWSGIGVAVAIAVTLAVIPLRPTQSQATDANLSVLSSNASEPSPSNGSVPNHGLTTVTNNPIDETASNSIITEQPSNPANAAGNPSSASGTGNTNGVYGGSSTTAVPSHEGMRTADSHSQSQNPNGTTAGGGDASGNKFGHEIPPAGTIAAKSLASPTPAWAGKSRDTGASNTAVVDDRIPPEDRDLVRAFFKPK